MERRRPAGAREVAAVDLQRITAFGPQLSLSRAAWSHVANHALVHESYLKLIDQRDARWQNRAHFFAIAAQAMRRILIDSARKHAAQKRGGPQEKLSLDEAANVSLEANTKLLALDEALNALAEIDLQQSRIVELRYFGGLTIEETAEVMNSSPATVKREWAMARAWLHQKLTESSVEGV